MYVEESGSKQSKCIVFIHGGGLSGWMWNKQVGDLKDFHCLVPDLPGHGKSKGIKPFSIKDSARQISELIKDKANGSRAYVVGHSLGAQILVQLLASSPDVVDRAVVVSALVRPIQGMVNLVKPTVKLTIPLTRFKWFARLQARALNIPEEYFDEYFVDSRTISTEAMEQILVENANFGLPKGLEYCNVPTLVLVGQKERRIMFNSAKDLVTAIPNSKGYLVQGVGHGFSFEDPKLFNEIVRAWFTDSQFPADRLKAIS
ncbi:MAG: alpha/beta hydrolase [Peptococcaceae bacterium]|nr:alpha/beta hydrolase [Peptococcaceae bacterium]